MPISQLLEVVDFGRLTTVGFEKYKQLGLTEMVEWESEHGKNKHRKEVISGWTKRDDHRHHAIDALTIACTNKDTFNGSTP